MFWTLYEYGQLTTNRPEHYAAIGQNLIILSLSLGPELVIVDGLRMILGLQVSIKIICVCLSVCDIAWTNAYLFSGPRPF